MPSLASQGDPHLHTHVVVANIGRGPEGTWSALDGRGVYAHCAAAGALYQSHLRHELTGSLGVAWDEPVRGRADVTGIGPEARRAFSRRSQEIAEHLAARGLGADAETGPGPDQGTGWARAGVSRRAAQVAGWATRAPKDLAMGADELAPWWRDRALAVGLGPRRLEAVLDRVPSRHAGSPGRAVVDVHAVAAVLAASRDPERAFARRDVVRAWAGSSRPGLAAAEVAAVTDRFMEELSAHGPHHADVVLDRPGVAERRVAMPEHLRRRELDVLLERREMTRAAVLEREAGLDRGLGLGLG